MPKKTLRGKRYLRSRKSVVIGRRKKRDRKFNRLIRGIDRAIRILKIRIFG